MGRILKWGWAGVMARGLLLACLAVPGLLLAFDGGDSGGAWTQCRTTGVGASARSVPSVGALGDQIFVFGGVKDDFAAGTNTFYNDLYRYDTRNGGWTRLAPNGPVPPRRAFAPGVGDERRGRFLVYGGSVYSPSFFPFTPLGDLWAYSPGLNTWEQIVPVNAAEGPVPRSGAHLWLVGDTLYVFGGTTTNFVTLNDLWALDLNANVWTLLVPDGAPGAPPPRHVAQGDTVARDGKLTFYGGEGVGAGVSFVQRADTWQYDLGTNTWANVTPPDALNINPARDYGTAGLIGDGLYLFGGDAPGGSSGCGAPFPQNPVDQLWRFELGRRIWTRIQPRGGQPPSLKRTSSAVVGDRMYVFSGYGFECPGPGQIWNTNVYSYEPDGS